MTVRHKVGKSTPLRMASLHFLRRSCTFGVVEFIVSLIEGWLIRARSKPMQSNGERLAVVAAKLFQVAGLYRSRGSTEVTLKV